MIAILGSGTDPVIGHVLPGKSEVEPGQPGDVDGSPISHDTATASVALAWDPGATILPIAVTEPDGTASMTAIALGIDDAVKSHATVISISYASSPSPPGTTDLTAVYGALILARRANIPVVFAAGNDHNDNDINPVFPGNDAELLTNVVSVAATDAGGRLAPFSNYGARSVTVEALGVGVPITLKDGTHATASGTSFATPEVAGLLGSIRAAHPHMAVAKVVHALKGCGVILHNPSGSSIG